MRCLAPALTSALTAGQLAQVARRMAALIVEVIEGTLSPLAQGLMQTEVLPAGVQPEVITLSGGVGSATAISPPILSVFRYRAAAGHGPARASAPA